MKFIKLIILLFLISACKDDIQITQGGNYNSNTRKYISNRINWEITIPRKWNITHIDTIKSQAKRGLDKVEFDKSEANIKKEIKSQYLIGFDKNKGNSFTAFIDETAFDKSNFNMVVKRTKVELIKQLNKQGIKTDTTWNKETISNIDFTVFHLTIDLPNSENDFHQEYYNTLIADKYLTILIGYDNQMDKTVLINTLRRSKFMN